MIIKTQRLLLRPWNLDDAEELYSLAKNPQIGINAGWKPHESICYSRQVIKDFLSTSESYAITLNDKIIGCISLKFNEQNDMSDRDDEAEIGYWLGVPFWNNGFMTEAVNAVIRHAFDDLNLHAVWGGYYDGNERSKRVQLKCGFTYHHTSNNLFVRQLNEYRTGYVNVIYNKRGCR